MRSFQRLSTLDPQVHPPAVQAAISVATRDAQQEHAHADYKHKRASILDLHPLPGEGSQCLCACLIYLCAVACLLFTVF